jgi:hypothetical protein
VCATNIGKTINIFAIGKAPKHAQKGSSHERKSRVLQAILVGLDYVRRHLKIFLRSATRQAFTHKKLMIGEKLKFLSSNDLNLAAHHDKY